LLLLLLLFIIIIIIIIIIIVVVVIIIIVYYKHFNVSFKKQSPYISRNTFWNFAPIVLHLFSYQTYHSSRGLCGPRGGRGGIQAYW